MSGEGRALRVIARIHNDFSGKFGLPRQAGLAPQLGGRIVFEPPFRQQEALRGIEGFSHLWLIWGFSGHEGGRWAATVRPPRLGGNERVGVFASRSPFRPNGLGLSCVRLESVELSVDQGPVLHVLGADLMDGSPIYDIKPYLPYADCLPEARGGFAGERAWRPLSVVFPEPLLALIPPDKRPALLEALAQDPRPAYIRDEGRVYGFCYAGFNLRFQVAGERLTVVDVRPLP